MTYPIHPNQQTWSECLLQLEDERTHLRAGLEDVRELIEGCGAISAYGSTSRASAHSAIPRTALMRRSRPSGS